MSGGRPKPPSLFGFYLARFGLVGGAHFARACQPLEVLIGLSWWRWVWKRIGASLEGAHAQSFRIRLISARNIGCDGGSPPSIFRIGLTIPRVFYAGVQSKQCFLQMDHF